MRIALIGMIAVLAACGSSTGPGSTLASLARHFDSLSATACHPPSSGLTSQPSCVFIEYAAMGIQQGVLPTQIQVSTNAGAGRWLGYAFLLSATPDTIYGVVAYDGLDVKNAIVAYIPVSHDDGAQALVGSTVWSSLSDSISGPGSASVISVGAQCSAIFVAAAGGEPPYTSQHCRLASFQVSLVITFLGTPSQTIDVFAPTISGFVLDSTASQYASSFGKLR